MTQLNITFMHLLKSWMGKRGTTGSWLQDIGLASKKMNKIIMRRRRINIVVMPDGMGIAVIWIGISCESRATKIYEIYKTNMSGEIPPSNHSF